MLALGLIAKLFTGEAGLFLARLKKVVALYAIAGVFMLLVIVFLFVALFDWIASSLGSLATALIFAGVFLLFGLIAFVLAKMAGRRPKERSDDRLQRDLASIAGVSALSSAPQLLGMMKQKRALIVFPAAAAGFFAVYRILQSIRDR